MHRRNTENTEKKENDKNKHYYWLQRQINLDTNSYFKMS